MALVNPAVLNALTFDWTRQKNDLRDQENRYRINYNSALDKMRRGYDDTTVSNNEGFADRGMLQSGASLKQSARLRDDYNRQQSEAAQALNTNLATIARRRLEADQQYKTKTLLAALGLSEV